MGAEGGWTVRRLAGTAHDLHHRTSQEEARDPDMQFQVMLSLSRESALDKRGIAGWMRRFQAYYFWPIGALYSWALRWNSVVALFRMPGETGWDRWLIPLHYALWLLLPLSLSGPLAVLSTYVVVSTVIALLLMAIFSIVAPVIASPTDPISATLLQ